MNFRARLFLSEKNEVDYDVYQLLTDAQKSKLANWSLVLEKSVKELIEESRFMAEQINEQSDEVYLFGVLPNCKLYGCMSPDGSTHT